MAGKHKSHNHSPFRPTSHPSPAVGWGPAGTHGAISFFKSLLEYNCFTVVLVSSIQQSESTIHARNSINMHARVHAYVLNLSSWVWLFATAWTVARQGPLSMGFSKQEYWSGLPFPPPKDLPNPEIWTHISYDFCIGRWILYHWATKEAPPPILFFGKEKFQKLFSSPSPMMGKCFHLKKVGHYSFFRDNTWKSCGRSWSMVFSTEAVIGGRYPMGYVSKTPGRGWPHIGRPSRQAGDLNFSLDDTCWNPSLSWVIWPPPPHP